MSAQTIEIDCPPGGLRPGDLMQSICKDAGLEYKEPVSKFFGHWTWDYSDMPEAEWKKVQPIAKRYIEKAYHRGIVRYGSW